MTREALLRRYDSWWTARQAYSNREAEETGSVKDTEWAETDEQAVALAHDLADFLRAQPAPEPVITQAPEVGWDGFSTVVGTLVGFVVRITNPGQNPIELLIESTQHASVSGRLIGAGGDWNGPKILRLELDDAVRIEVC